MAQINTAVMYVGDRVGANAYMVGTYRYAFGANPQTRSVILPQEHYFYLKQTWPRDFIEIPISMAMYAQDVSQSIGSVFTIKSLTDDFKIKLIKAKVKSIGQVLTFDKKELSELLTTDEDSAVTLINEIRGRYGLPLVDPPTPAKKKKAEAPASTQ
jgi:hypothetical protein